MPSAVAVPLAALFVFLAGFNVWIMLTERGASPRSRRLWSRAHRIAGHTFIALFVVFCYFMLMRVRGSSDELSPRLILHMGLAFLLAPLLLAKVMAVRYQKDAWKLLMVLGIGIFGTAFTLVALNVSVHYLRIAAKHKMASGTSGIVIVVALCLAVIGYLSGIKRLKQMGKPVINGTENVPTIAFSVCGPVEPYSTAIRSEGAAEIPGAGKSELG